MRQSADSQGLDRDPWDTYFIKVAHSAAIRGTCPRLRVGAVLVRDNRILSTGYNGAASGEPHCFDVGCLLDGGRCKRTIHAERNAIQLAPRWSRHGSTLFCTDSPCLSCAVLVSTLGIIEVVYDRPYHAEQPEVKTLFDYHGIVLRQHAYAAQETITA